MSKNLSAKYYQENKERLQKKLVKDIKIFLKKKKKKSNNMAVNVTEMSQKKKKINYFSIEKNTLKEKKLFFKLGSSFLKYKKNIRLESSIF